MTVLSLSVQHFDGIRHHAKDSIENDEKFWFIEPKDRVYWWIEKFSELLASSKTLFIIDDITSDESLDKMTQSLLELAMSGRHRDHYLWLLTQSYSSIQKNIRSRAKSVFVWCPKEKEDLKKIYNENNVFPVHELVFIREQLKKSKHAYLYMGNEHPRGFNILMYV